MSQYEYGTLRQTLLRHKLHAVEYYLDRGMLGTMSMSYETKIWFEQRRRDTIEELNRVQLEEWNYD